MTVETGGGRWTEVSFAVAMLTEQMVLQCRLVLIVAQGIHLSPRKVGLKRHLPLT